MRRLTILLVLAGLATLPVVALAETYFGFQIGISNAPPPPAVVFREAPQTVFVPETGVYVVDDDEYGCDVFRYSTYWYACNGRYWYRARNYSGPFRVVDVRYIPRQVLTVPAGHWHHHPLGGPPGLMRKNRVVVVNDRDRDRDHDRDHDHGHGHGHH